MKRLLLPLLLVFPALYTFLSAQEKDYIKQPILGVNFLFNDFGGGGYLKTYGLNRAIRDKQIGQFKTMSPGLSINYISGISKYLDLSAGISGSFLDYPISGKSAFGNDNLLLEGDVSVNAKMLPDKYWFIPYLSAGAGVSKYKGYYGAFVPLGTGIQVNFYDEAYIFINAQYRFGITENTSNHLYYSIGVAGNIANKKEPKTVMAPPPPLPVAEAPKDTDGDGITDSLDACPDVAGLAKFNGCPDTDSDGITDKEDKCPTIPGLARYQGCPVPDRDKDGVNDEVDKCPDLAGDALNSGCPVIAVEVIEKVTYAAKRIFFASGKSALMKSSAAALNEVAAILKNTSDLKLDIDGYTDNSGKAENNQLLSQRRANAVKSFLVSKEVSADKLSATGHGQDDPLADNKTAAGRAKNRRVVLHLKYF
jgi:OOP family OmpA-OmpF porin